MNYSHLSIEERVCIFHIKKSDMRIRQIAQALRRSPATISRKPMQNSQEPIDKNCEADYSPSDAQIQYHEERKRCHRPCILTADLKSYIREKIREHWSPDQISNRKCQFGDHIPSTSTIYRYVHKNRLQDTSMRLLRRKGTFKRPAETRGKFNDKGRTIRKLPKEVYKREEIGHWEGDTVESGRNDHKKKSKYCFVTLAERKSRKFIAVLVPIRRAADVTPAIINALKDYPNEMIKTITFDRGKEFAQYEEIEEVLNCKTYFCDLYCAWQTGTDENSNGLLREFYPKGMDLSEVKENELNHNIELMNNRPRRCLNY